MRDGPKKMKNYHPAHAVFFEAAIENLPTPILEWLAIDLPKLEDMVPHRNGLVVKDSIEWKTIVNRAQPDMLPDYCLYCDTLFEYIPGGQIREGCPNCIENFPADADSRIMPYIRIALAIDYATDGQYFAELVEYLFCCHIHWRMNVQWNPKPKQEVKPDKRSLMETLRGS